MHLLTIKKQTRPWLPLLFLRNFVDLLFGYKPANTTKKSWLFGHYKRLKTQKIKCWFCFNCHLKLLTPKEYEQLRNAYYAEATLEDGQEKAAELVGRLDAALAGHEEAG
jgi:hypothetical protein